MKNIVTSLLLLTFSLCGHAEALNRHVSYELSAIDLVTFSRHGVTARLCDTCEVQSFTVSANTRLLERGTPVDLSQATELYLRKKYDSLLLGIDRTENSVNYISFGGYASDIH